MSEWPWDGQLLPEPAIAMEDTFEGFLKLEWEELSEQSAAVRFHIRDNLRQPLGLLHGGIYPAVAETVASVATMLGVWRDGMLVAGLSNCANFMRPAIDGTVHVKAVCKHRGDTEWLWSHTFTDDQNRLCATVDVIIAVRPRRP